MKRISCALILIVILCAVPAFAADWPMFRKDALHQANADELLQPPLREKWHFTTEGKIISSPSVYKNAVLIGSRDNYLYCINTDNGGLNWKFKTKGWVDSSAAASDDKIYVSSRDGNLYCLNFEDGKLLWKYTTGGTDFSSPLVADNKVFCASGFPNKFIYALDAETGKEIWKVETNQMVYSSAALYQDEIYIGSNDGHVYCLNKDTGAVVWKYQTKGGIYMASPTIDVNKLFFSAGDFDWSVYALNLDKGTEAWKYEIEDNQPTPNYVSTVAVSDKGIFIIAGYEQQYIYCLNGLNGKLQWKQALGPAARYGFSSSACVTEDIVYIASAKGILIGLEISTGVLKWQYGLSSGVLSSPTVADGKLFIATIDGKLYAFE
ncbi:MAG: PQQ-binding-like beta-propeller repeat protein [Candidatus Omnitrophica bacterium]|nr:PQQ-binding-like beta-propeller repeat protein [Candidatus Omnitrophota bacterium]